MFDVQFLQRKKAMKSNGYTEKELSEVFAFQAFHTYTEVVFLIFNTLTAVSLNLHMEDAAITDG